jgi:pyrroloquinoline quinone (PQQ) biosynthesis protein C
MTLPYDGRSGVAPAYQPGALSPEEFQDEYVEAIVKTFMRHVPKPGVPEGLAPEDARRFHGNLLKHFSFFAWVFPSWLMSISSRCPYQDVRAEVIKDCVDEEVGDPDADGACHIEVLYQEAEACGVSREEIFATEPNPEIMAGLLALDDLARNLHWVASFAATGALEIINSEPAFEVRTRLVGEQGSQDFADNMGGVAFHERLGLPEGALKFLALHSYKDRFHGGGELRLVVKYANTRELQREAIWAGEQSLRAMGVMQRAIVREAYASIGIAPDEQFLAQALV